MNSTDDAELARRFFKEHILPVASALNERGVSLIDTALEEEGSWYVPPPDDPDFSQITDGNVANELRALWTSQGLSELADLVEPLMALAQNLKVHGHDDKDVSPFVYVMY